MDLYNKRIALVTYTDYNYLPKAKMTIGSIRTNGKYYGDLVVITDGLFQIDKEYIFRMNLIIKEYPDIDVTKLLEKIREHPFTNSDGRELYKIKQWNKLYVFDTYFKQWDYIMFLDAGIMVIDDIVQFYPQFIANKLVALDDGHPEFIKKFHTQIELSNVPIVEKLKQIYDINSNYFLNCLFIFDTSLIRNTENDTPYIDTLSELIGLMNEYPICRTNEMTIMNIYFAKDWLPMNIYLPNGKILFDWCERNGNPSNKYVALKYPFIPYPL